MPASAISLEKMTLDGPPARDAAFFKTNEFVEGLNFVPTATRKP